jgi:hypothetical protein
MSYSPINAKMAIKNSADEFSRIFLYRGNENMLENSRKQYFEADTETSLIADNHKDQQVVAWSLAPKESPYSRYAVCSYIYTDNNTALTGLFDTLVRFGCDETYVYFHNLDYDGMFILNWLIKSKKYKQIFDRKLTVKDITTEEYRNKFGVLYNGGLYEIRVIYSGKCIIIRDSMKLWNISIENISDELIRINESDIKSGRATSFPLVRKKSELSYEYDKIRRFGERISDTEQRYMLNDVLVGVSILQMFSKFSGLGLSCAGMAYKMAFNSFQDGVLTADVVKYLIKTKFDEMAKNHEFESFIKVVVHDEETYLFTKTYYTIDYDDLTKKSDEFICSFKTVYLSFKDDRQRALTDIQNLLDTPKLQLSNLIMKSLQGTTEFKAIKSVRNNIVFKMFRESNVLNFSDAVIKFVNLQSLKGLKKAGAKKIKSFDYYYQSVFKPLTFEEDAEIRTAYRGGLSAAVELYSNQLQHNVISIDINSSYPYQMQDKELPYGGADVFESAGNAGISLEELENIKKNYKTFIIQFQASYQLQEPFNPIMAQKAMYGYAKFRNFDTQYRQINEGEWLYMTNVEFELFAKTHNVKIENVFFKKIWAYQSFKGIFDPFVSKMYQIKKYYRGTAMYEPIKQMLNSVYGRYAMNRFKFDCYDNIAELDNKNILRFKTVEKDKIDWNAARGSYLPISIFITSYALILRVVKYFIMILTVCILVQKIQKLWTGIYILMIFRFVKLAKI